MSSEVIDEKNHPIWTRLWEDGLKPGVLFDKEGPSPLLVKYIREDKIPKGRCLIPGCGRGYDVNELGKDKDRFVIGIDIVETAVQSAQEWYNSLPESEKANEANVRFQTANFFDFPENDESKFDFIYDYTFFCAISPTLRNEWASKMSRLLKPGGILMTLMFPIRDTTTPLSGPPYAVDFSAYESVLSSRFENLEYFLLTPDLSHPGRGRNADDPAISGVGIWKLL